MKRIQYRINFFDFDRLNKLLNIFGLSLRIENGCCLFTDIETGLRLAPYIYYAEHGYMKIYTNDAETLLNSYPFYLETRTKFYKLGISDRKDTFVVGNIFKREKIKSNFYEETDLESDHSECKLKERTYNYDEASCPMMTNINEVNYSTSELIYPAQGVICVKNPDWSRNIELWYNKNRKTGEAYLMGTSDCRTMSLEEATSLVEQSRVFKEVMELFTPNTLEGYTNSKSTALTRKMEKPQ